MPDGLARKKTRTTCPYCGVGCGIVAIESGNGQVTVAGDPDHPANKGRLCGKGAALAETLGHDGRLLHPMIGARRVSWDQAVATVAQNFHNTIAEHGPDSVAFYVSGQLLTEDYYVANKLMKGFIGSANIDTNSRLCMASSVAGHRRAFGSDTVPGCYEDLEQADLVVAVGSNFAWCHPVLAQRLADARAARPGMRIVLIDPRRSASAELADMHLAIKPDSDVALFNGLLRWLQESGCVDQDFLARHTSGFDEALAAAQRTSFGETARLTGLSLAELLAFYRLFALSPQVVTLYSQGVNQSAGGTDKVNAILNCHLLTGRIGKPGTGPFSLTGQPNAMGGREVGGLANQLACHMEIENPAHRALVQRFWRAPAMPEQPGLKAVELFDAVAEGRIKALWIMATNPAVSLPQADKVRAALKTCPFVVVSDVEARTDTTELADVLLPAAGWGEKDGTVTNSERRISRQRAFLPPPGEAKPDWRILCDVAAALGWGAAFAYDSPWQIFREYAALTAAGNDGARDLDLSGCLEWEAETYDVAAPFQWPLRAGEKQGQQRFFAEGGFFTEDGRARFVAVKPPEPRSSTLPFLLNTGRVRDQWHTMTRSGRSPRLAQHVAEPFVEIHPDDAKVLGVVPAGLLKLSNHRGDYLARAVVTRRQQPGQLFAPMHWTAQTASSGRVDALVSSRRDPHSGQPALKMTRVAAEAVDLVWYGFAVVALRPAGIDADYWAVARTESGWRLELGGRAHPADWQAFAGQLFGLGDGEDVELLAYVDADKGSHRFAAFAGARPLGLLYVAAEPVAASRAWVCRQFDRGQLEGTGRCSLLVGRPSQAAADPGPIVCSCFAVGRNAILTALAGGAGSVEGVGAATSAGSNCGSCRAEIQGLIDHVSVAAAE
ncbi:molybdopterin-dependent oxidoreductase [Pelagibius sp. 7325]|uniref:nitrate reductase n=1 Tax=Pelagibius sp. 7325 TaxID=3131994 RepID=UPI0030EC28E6